MRPADPETSPPFQKRRRAKTRPALMLAGLKLLAERPVDSLSIDEIVEAAGPGNPKTQNPISILMVFIG